MTLARRPEYPAPHRRARRLHAAALGWLIVLAGTAAMADDDDWERARELQSAGKILSLEHFMEKAVDVHPGRVIDAKLKWEDSHGHYVYEIDVLDHRGEIWEVEFDARSGTLVERERRGH